MSNKSLPEGWEYVEIGSFAQPENTKNTEGFVTDVVSVTKYRGIVDSLEYFNKQIYSKDVTTYKIIKRNQFAYATIHLDEGSIGYLSHKDVAALSPMYTVFSIDESKVDKDFLFALLKSHDLMNIYQHCGSGSVNRRKAISFDAFKKIKVSLPPLREQQRITEILGSVDQAMNTTRQVIDQTRQVKSALMQELLTRGLPGQHTRFKQTPLGEIPEDWDVIPANEACHAVIDCKNRTPKFTEKSEYIVVRTSNVRDGRFLRDNVSYTDESSFTEWTKRGTPEPGDVIITREAPVGEVCLVPADLKVCLGQRLMLYKPKQDMLDSGFLLYSLQSEKVQKYLDKISGGSTVGHVRVGDIRELPFLIPPKEEQLVITALAASFDQRLEHEFQYFSYLKLLKGSLLQALLTGEKRVGVADQHDELLEVAI